jgi:hypothetical protein
MKHSTKNIKAIALFLLILSVAISSLYFLSTSSNPKEAIKKEISHKKKAEEEAKVSSLQSIQAVVPFIQFDLVTDLYLVAKFEFAEKKVEFINESELPYIFKYFKTLFCFVISTKAP